MKYALNFNKIHVYVNLIVLFIFFGLRNRAPNVVAWAQMKLD